MPSPFPGMDPYLEARSVFPGLHDGLIYELRAALQSRLPSPYWAEMADRVWVELTDRNIGPDVTVRRSDSGPTAAVAEAVSRPAPGAVLVTVPHDEHREPCLEIYAGDDRLVTTIEVLSPGNKTADSKARELYLRKQDEMLDSKVHLVEIDLLRDGEHTTAVSLDYALCKTGPFDYHVCVHRYDHFEDYEVYPIRLRDRLPEVAIPLMPDDPDVAIDLQAVFDRAYETGPYARSIRYDRPSEVALDDEEAAWAEQLLAKKDCHESRRTD